VLRLLLVLPLLLHAVSVPRLDLLGGRGGVAELALVCVGVGVLFTEGVRFDRRALAWLVALLPLLASIPLALDRSAAAVQCVVLVYVGGLYVIGVRLGSRADGAISLHVYTAGCVFVAMLGLVGVVLAWCGLDSHDLARSYQMIITSPRATGPTETPAMLGVACSTGLVGTCVLAQHGVIGTRTSWLYAAALAAALVATQSRAVAVMLVALPFALLEVSLARWSRRALVVVAASGFAMLIGSLRFRLLPLTVEPPFIDLHTSLYAMCHELAADTFSNHPLSGVGLEGFHDAFRSQFTSSRFAEAFEGLPMLPDGAALDPHSTYFGYLAEAGVFGIASELSFLGLIVVCLRRSRGPLLAAFVVAVLSGLFLDVLTNRALALLIGLLVGLESHDTNTTQSPR